MACPIRSRADLDEFVADGGPVRFWAPGLQAQVVQPAGQAAVNLRKLSPLTFALTVRKLSGRERAI
jgi:hypothetical protein